MWLNLSMTFFTMVGTFDARGDFWEQCTGTGPKNLLARQNFWDLCTGTGPKNPRIGGYSLHISWTIGSIPVPKKDRLSQIWWRLRKCWTFPKRVIFMTVLWPKMTLFGKVQHFRNLHQICDNLSFFGTGILPMVHEIWREYPPILGFLGPVPVHRSQKLWSATVVDIMYLSPQEMVFRPLTRQPRIYWGTRHPME